MKHPDLDRIERDDLDVQRFSSVRAGDVRWKVMKHVNADLAGRCVGCKVGEGATLEEALNHMDAQ